MEPLADILKHAELVRVRVPEAPAEPVCPRCQGAGYLRYDVPLYDPHFGQIVPCECTRRDMERRRLERLVEKSNLGTLRHLTFETFILKYRGSAPPPRTSDAAYRVARAYAEKPERWLVLFGNYGTGKTHLAVSIANYRLQQGEPAIFIVVPDLLDHLRSTFSPTSDVAYDDLFETVRNTPLLILDDFGSHTSTPWAQEKLYQLLNHRYNRELPTVITTNLSPDEIEPRLRSRIGDSRISTLCEIRDIDKRLGIAHPPQGPTTPPGQKRAVRRVREDERL